MNSLEKEIYEICCRAKSASRELTSLSTITKNTILRSMASLLENRKKIIQEENYKDIYEGEQKGLSDAMLDRLRLSDEVIESMVNGLEEVASLPDPVGSIENTAKQPNGLMVGRMNVPLGVIGMIFESRPNVTVDAAALCLKAGNSIILRGGSEAIFSNKALAKIMQEALAQNNINQDSIQVIPVIDRLAVDILLKQEDCIDLIIPRGGEGLIRFVAENSRIPVLKHYKGVCHIFVDEDADLNKAIPIILNSKTQRPGVCNALEGVLIHKNIADSFLPVIVDELTKKDVRLLGCNKSQHIDNTIVKADVSDWGTEFLNLTLCVKIVEDYDEAKKYIETYGSQHTECIISENYSLVQKFITEIDASAVIVNASTRFNDGGQLGLGAEIGISTTKLHAYGPMGLEELTTRKFVVYGEGQVRN